jgi:hypothetical protein
VPQPKAKTFESYSKESVPRGAAKQRHALSDYFSEAEAQPSSQLNATLSGMAAALSSAL